MTIKFTRPILALWILCGVACAQTNRFPPINTYTGDPTGGACSITNSLVQSTTTGGIYSCVSGVWTSSTIPFNGGTIANPLTGTSATFSGVNQGQLRDNCGEKCNLLAFGAVADAKVSKLCSMTAASNVLTCDDAPFSAGDVGKPIAVQYAGAFLTTQQEYETLETTIAGYTDASHVTLTASAVNTTPVGIVDPDGVHLIGGPTTTWDLGNGSITQDVTTGVTGTAGQTCTLSGFLNLGAATATVALSATNTLTNGSLYIVTNGGGGNPSVLPTSATLGNGTATCTGTVTVASSVAAGFGYYSGQWQTTTTGSGTGSILSFYADGLGGFGVNGSMQPTHFITNGGTGYAVNDLLCPVTIGADGHGCFKIDKVSKTAAIWGTKNNNAVDAWLAACQGTTSCYVPSAKFLVSTEGGTHKFLIPSNTTLTMEPQGAFYQISGTTGGCAHGSYAFGTAANASNVHIRGFHAEGEQQVWARFHFGCPTQLFWIGNQNNNIEISSFVLQHSYGGGIVAFSTNGSAINIHHGYVDQTQDSGFNVNTAHSSISYTTVVNSSGFEMGGNPEIRISHNDLISPFGFYPIGVGGASGGGAYYGGLIDYNNVMNPIGNGISVASGFSKGAICNNLVTGMTGWHGQNNALVQGGSLVYAPTFDNLICNNKFESAQGGNNAYGGIAISAYNGPDGSLQGSMLQGNVSEYFANPAYISGTGTVYGVGNTWHAPTGFYDFSVSSGSPTYISSGDILAQGRVEWNNTLGSIQGTFINGLTGSPILIGSSFQQQSSLPQNPTLNWLTSSGLLQGYGLSSIQIPALTAPSIAGVGTGGSTTYTYYCTAVSGNGIETSAGTTTSTATGNATLSATNYNAVTCPFTLGAATMNVYRTVGGATQGRIATGLTNGIKRTINDTGLSGTGSFAPATNLTGGIKVGSTYYAPSTICKSDGTNCPSTPILVASGTTALATSAIASATCQTVTAGSVNSSTATGALSTDKVAYNTSGSLSAVTGYAPSTSGGLTFNPYLTSGFINFDVCNWTAGSITPGAVTVQWSVLR